MEERHLVLTAGGVNHGRGAPWRPGLSCEWCKGKSALGQWVAVMGFFSYALMRKSAHCLKTCRRIQLDRTAVNEIKDAARMNLSSMWCHFNLSKEIFIWPFHARNILPANGMNIK